LTRVVVAACVGVIAIVPSATSYASTRDDVAATRDAVDDAAQRWFDAQYEAARIDERIAHVEHAITEAHARVDVSRELATEAAVMLYKSADVSLTPGFGDDAIDAGRRAQLVENANATSAEVIDRLTAALDDLEGQRRELAAARKRQQDVLAAVAAERGELERQLSGLRAQVAGEAKEALAAAREQDARERASARVPISRAVPSTASTAPPVRPVEATPEPEPRVAPPATGAVSAHHDHPFLVCTRMRESGGNYSIVSPAGYHGAYQFLPSTWDATASHAGRMDLVGVLPSRASAYDQDEMAWTLYQWQGKRPWGGRC
jgi:peptidoglycan hydrolase CwlO-like protein